jgi:ketosteroid isomerase-like protein
VSKEDLETVRAAYSAWNRGDDSFFEYVDPSVEWIPPPQFVSGSVKGITGLKELLASITDAFEHVQWQPVQLFETGRDGEVFALLDNYTRGKGSGAEVTVRVAHLLRLRDGKLVWGRSYADVEEGMRAAGLESAG